MCKGIYCFFNRVSYTTKALAMSILPTCEEILVECNNWIAKESFVNLVKDLSKAQVHAQGMSSPSFKLIEDVNEVLLATITPPIVPITFINVLIVNISRYSIVKVL